MGWADRVRADMRFCDDDQTAGDDVRAGHTACSLHGVSLQPARTRVLTIVLRPATDPECVDAQDPFVLPHRPTKTRAVSPCAPRPRCVHDGLFWDVDLHFSFPPTMMIWETAIFQGQRTAM